MAYQENSGPSGRPNSQISFGSFPLPPTDSPPPPSHSGHEVLGREQPPPVFQHSGPAPSFPNQSAGINVGAEAAARTSVQTPGFESTKSEASHPPHPAEAHW